MARPPTIKDEEILHAAREVFLEHGIQATTAQVARRAGIAEGSIFNRFKTKADLFQAAMRPDIDEPPFLHELESRVGKDDLRTVLFDLGLAVVDFFRGVLPLVLMSWSNPGPSGVPALFDVPEPLPVRVIARVTAFFQAEMKKRRLADRDPEVAARMFLGSLANYVLTQVLLRVRSGMDPATFVRSVVEILMDGLAPESQEGATRGSP
jgi:AcrR family transcriptional regulator